MKGCFAPSRRRAMKTSAPFLCTIEKLVFGGKGLGRHPDGRTVFVAGVLPGEEVSVVPVQEKKDYMEARLAEVRSASSLRVSPPCPHYERCGGCDFQHALSSAQPELKAAILADTLIRIAGWSLAATAALVAPPLPSPVVFGYRQRLRLHVDSKGRLGFRQARSHAVEPIVSCLVARPELNTLLATLPRSKAMTRLLKLCTGLEILTSANETGAVLLLHAEKRPGHPVHGLVEEVMQDIAEIKGLFIALPGQRAHGPLGTSAFPEEARHIRFLLPQTVTGSRALNLLLEPGGFCQVNQAQNEAMIRLALDWTQPTEDTRVLDLFCGMGNFSLPFALRAGRVTGLDVQEAAIRCALLNAREAGLHNCRFVKATADEGLERLIAQGESFDLVLLDPPRSGCAEIIPNLRATGARRLLYISCQPPTLARDLRLLAGQGFAVERLQAIDMFPQTHHLETMVLLTLR